MKKSLVTIILLFLFIESIAQSENGFGILVNNYMQNETFGNIIHNGIKEGFKNKKNIHIYRWDESQHSIDKVETSKEIIKPIKFVKYVQTGVFNVQLNPEINITTDTSGKTTSVYFEISPYASLQYKLIDISTSQIMDLGSRNLDKQSNYLTDLGLIPVKNYIEDFGGDPAMLRKKDYQSYDKLLKKVKEKYSKIIYENTLKIVNNYAINIYYSISNLGNVSSQPYYKVLKDENAEDEKKIKYINFQGGKKDSIKVGNEFALYQIVDFEQIKSTKRVNVFYVDEVGEKVSKAKIAFLGNKKRIAELIKENAELYLFENNKSVLEYNKMLNKNNKFYNVGVRKNCLFCEIKFEENLISVPVINTIERNAPEIRYFQEIAKLEKFIDFKSQELLNKQLGIKYLFYKEEGNLTATDIETGRVVGSESSKQQYLIAMLTKNLFLDIFEKNIKFLKNKDFTKNKVKEIYLYSDFGLTEGEKIKVYTLIEEKVGNKVLKRKEEIGSGYITKAISDFVGVLNLQKGEKDIFEAQSNNIPLYFDYKIK